MTSRNGSSGHTFVTGDIMINNVKDLDLFFLLFSSSLSLVGNSDRLTCIRHKSHTSSATHFYPCVQYFCLSKQWHGCQCLGFLTWAQMLMHAIAHGGCTDTVLLFLWRQQLNPWLQTLKITDFHEFQLWHSAHWLPRVPTLTFCTLTSTSSNSDILHIDFHEFQLWHSAHIATIPRSAPLSIIPVSIVLIRDHLMIPDSEDSWLRRLLIRILMTSTIANLHTHNFDNC